MKPQEFILGFLCSLLLLLGVCFYYVEIQVLYRSGPLRVIDNQNYSPKCIKILVLGAVKKPGNVVITQDPPRLIDAINQAGGLDELANVEVIKFAQDIKRATIIAIPFYYENEVKIIKTPESKKKFKHKKSKHKKHSTHKKGKKSKHHKIKKSQIKLQLHSININTVSKERLMLLPGIGDKLSDRIIQYRSKNLFKDSEDILKIKGIGEKKLAKILPYIVF